MTTATLLFTYQRGMAAVALYLLMVAAWCIMAAHWQYTKWRMRRDAGNGPENADAHKPTS